MLAAVTEGALVPCRLVVHGHICIMIHGVYTVLLHLVLTTETTVLSFFHPERKLKYSAINSTEWHYVLASFIIILYYIIL